MSVASRRPLATRDKAWARALARAVGRTRIRPNWISMLSVGFATAAGVCLWASGRAWGVERIVALLLAAAAIQLRLLCNLLDGMVAMEGGKKSRTGDIFNDLPDRFADLLILVPLGYALDGQMFSHELGWLAGVLAVLTAYVRMLGGSLGLKQDFSGPMAKQQRMAVMTAACVLACFEPLLHWRGVVMELALIVIVAGCVATLVRRTIRLARELESR